MAFVRISPLGCATRRCRVPGDRGIDRPSDLRPRTAFVQVRGGGAVDQQFSGPRDDCSGRGRHEALAFGHPREVQVGDHFALMPPDHPWPADWIATYERWMADGFQP
jgi:hypothetical protein